MGQKAPALSLLFGWPGAEGPRAAKRRRPPRRPGYRCPQKDTMNPQGKGGRGTDSRYFFFGSRVKRVSKGNISSRPNSISKVRTSLDRTEKDP